MTIYLLTAEYFVDHEGGSHRVFGAYNSIEKANADVLDAMKDEIECDHVLNDLDIKAQLTEQPYLDPTTGNTSWDSWEIYESDTTYTVTLTAMGVQ